MELASKAFEQNVSEIELWKTFIHTSIELGASSQSMNGHFGVGKQSGSPYDEPTNYVLSEGDILRFERGASYKGYNADICRVAVIGKPTEHAAKLHNALKVAQQKLRDTMKPGVKFSDLFKLGQSTVRELGFPRYTRGHFGHSISLRDEEPPYLSFQKTERLQPGMVLAVELPYYIIDAYGMNIEDDVLVTEDGIESFSKLSRELVCLPIKK